MAFTHLGVRSEYAIVDSIVRLKDLIAKAKKDGQTSLGLADFKNTFAFVKFYTACTKAGIKPLLGVEVVTGNHIDNIAEKECHSVILYAMNNDGYQNILRLVSDSYTNRPMGDNGKVSVDMPIVVKSDLLDPTKNAGIIAILTHRSEIISPLHGGMGAVQTWKDAFGDRLYMAVKRTHKGDDDFNKEVILTAHKFDVPVIAHNDVRFMNASPKIIGKEATASTDFEAHEARVCIASGYVLNDSNRPHLYSELQYFKTQQEMEELFSDIPQVIENTNLLASRCNVTLTLGKNFLPAFPIPDGMTEEEFFRKTSEDGLNRRLDKLYPPETRDETWADVRKAYDERLDFEVGIILKMGFPGYFLIVMDFIRWAKENGVPVGPGRGSGAGSLVAYSLNITDLDPLRYDLLFERFLNPERVSMPDFDVDFCIEGRDRVIAYVAEAYGRMAVSQIITFGTMAAKAVVRDVARVQGKPLGLADKISKLIPKTPGITLAEAIGEEPLLYDLLYNPDAQDHELAREIWEMAEKLEGLTRNVGKHAGGVLIAPNRISDFSAVYCDDEGHFVSQYDKGDVEAVGLVKFDFLGLRNLTVIKSAIDNIDARLAKEGKPPIDLDTLPLDDMDVYRSVLQTGNTTAVFQLESSGMKKYLKKLKPSNIEDIIAMCALYRPGPLESGMVTRFIDRKHGIEAISYPDPNHQHPSLQATLEPTYGTIVYQEQVMQIAQVMAGYTLGGADMLRRAMGKKDVDEMTRQRQTFIDGSVNNNIDGELAGAIFDLVRFFAGYGFNKSHSAAYGVLAYQTAYLKHYYPAEFMSAVLTSEMRDTDTIVFLIGDCKDNFNLTVLPPSVNHSQFHFVAHDPKTIIYGLGAVKGVGEDAVASIVKARQDGKFKDLYDFCNRVDIKKVGKRALEALICAGCFDDLAGVLRPDLAEYHRPYDIRGGLWEQLPSAMEVANQNRQNQVVGTMDLFAEVDDGLSIAPPLPPIIWDNQTRLKGENDTLGLYLTGHPLDKYRDELKRYTNIKSLAELSDDYHVARVAGLVVDVANFGNRVAITLDDGTARLEVSCYSDKFMKLKDTLEVNLALSDRLLQKYQPLTANDSKINLKRLNAISLAKIDKSDWASVENLNGAIIIARLGIRDRDGKLFFTLHGANNLVQARLRYLSAINIKLASDDTDKLNQLIGLLKENAPPDPFEVEKFIKSQSGDEDEEPIVHDGCLPINLYLYDDCGICRAMVNDRFRIYPSDDILTHLMTLFDKQSLKIA